MKLFTMILGLCASLALAKPEPPPMGGKVGNGGKEDAVPMTWYEIICGSEKCGMLLINNPEAAAQNTFYSTNNSFASELAQDTIVAEELIHLSHDGKILALQKDDVILIQEELFRQLAEQEQQKLLLLWAKPLQP